jgi:hypothetical protein
MSLMTFSIKHGCTQEEARRRLEQGMKDAQSQFGTMIHSIDWEPGHDRVKVVATGGVHIDMHLDAESLHLKADVPMFLKMMARPMIENIKGMLEGTFQKRLP